MTGPAHLPELKPQQPEAQSASLVQGPVMNCVPAPFVVPSLLVDGWAATAVVVDLVDAWAATAVEVDLVDAWAATAVEVDMAVGWPSSERAAVSLGCASPNPQPPSRSWAMTGPAHLPELKPQQPEAQSASLVQGPVMNCVP